MTDILVPQCASKPNKACIYFLQRVGSPNFENQTIVEILQNQEQNVLNSHRKAFKAALDHYKAMYMPHGLSSIVQIDCLESYFGLSNESITGLGYF